MSDSQRKPYQASYLMFRLFIGTMALSTTEAFRSTRTASYTMPKDYGSSRATGEDWVAVLKAEPQLKKPKYDFGIGKNKVVNWNMAVSSDHKYKNDGNDEVGVGEFIIEYEGVQQFPSPPRETKVEPLPSATKKKILPNVQPRRNVSDLLDITVFSTDELPLIIPLYESSVGGMVEPLKLDPNTIWVEMMLHDEMNKYSLHQ